MSKCVKFCIVNWPYSQQYEGEISVLKGDVVGVIDSNIGDAAMYKVGDDNVYSQIPCSQSVYC